MVDRSESAAAPDTTPGAEPADSTSVTDSTEHDDSSDPSDSTDSSEHTDASTAQAHARGYPETPPHRRRAVLATIPFLILGLAVVAFGVVASPRPLFGFLIFPPVVFVSALTYIAFRSRFEADAE